ncbi:MAG: hypothetical protein QE271_09425 [Bacteriovoracaceae bacterium]|nr:hypothetical protein [Bacteriovoracaceae bacterium]
MNVTIVLCLAFLFSIVMGIPLKLTLKEQVSLYPPYVVHFLSNSRSIVALVKLAKKQKLICKNEREFCLVKSDKSHLMVFVPNKLETCKSENEINFCENPRIEFEISTQDWLKAGLKQDWF